MLLLYPNKTKYKKQRKGKLTRYCYKSKFLRFGVIGLKSIESGFISTKQLEAARQAINRKIKRKGKIWVTIFPNIPITAKPTEVRMGKGKGSVKHWSARIRGGTTLFEICGVSNKAAVEAFKTGRAKLPVKTCIFT